MKADKPGIPDILQRRYLWMKQHAAAEVRPGTAVEIFAKDRVGLISDISAAVSTTGTSLFYIQSWNDVDGTAQVLIQFDAGEREEALIAALTEIPAVRQVHKRPTYMRTYGKRVIIIGGGAQVAQVAFGAITEADRHNIRGEAISVDTMAVVGAEPIAQAIRGVGRLHRAAVLVLAGSLMGGTITDAVRELREFYGVPVISLTMAGSVNDASDLVVTDPTEAGVMSVMLISHIGKFDLLEVHGDRY